LGFTKLTHMVTGDKDKHTGVGQERAVLCISRTSHQFQRAFLGGNKTRLAPCAPPRSPLMPWRLGQFFAELEKPMAQALDLRRSIAFNRR
jgi:hypothetical protein